MELKAIASSINLRKADHICSIVLNISLDLGMNLLEESVAKNFLLALNTRQMAFGVMKQPVLVSDSRLRLGSLAGLDKEGQACHDDSFPSVQGCPEMGINLPPPRAQSNVSPLRPIVFGEGSEHRARDSSKSNDILAIQGSGNAKQRSSLLKAKTTQIRTVFADDPVANAVAKFVVKDLDPMERRQRRFE